MTQEPPITPQGDDEPNATENEQPEIPPVPAEEGTLEEGNKTESGTPPPENGESADTDLASPEAIKMALTFAWHRFNGYDEQSSSSKNNYQLFRTLIIVISLATTFLAVASTLFPGPIILSANIISNALAIDTLPAEIADTLSPDAIDTLSATLAENLPAEQEATTTATNIFKILLVALPLISAGLLAYVTSFESGNAWVGFRVAAENIKVGIYSLRVKAWLKSDTVTEIENLNVTIRKASQILESLGVTTPVRTQDISLESDAIAPRWVDEPGKDDGYTAMTLADYIHWRVLPQTRWYRKVIRRDYRLTRILRALILLVSGAGAFIAAVGYIEWVAVSVAGAAGLIAYLGLHQWEVNYGNYMRTARKLEDEVRCFITTFGDYKRPIDEMTEQDKKDILAFVDRIEKVFNDEREIWRFSILQSQEATESAITQMVSTYRSDPDDIPGIDDQPGNDSGDGILNDH